MCGLAFRRLRYVLFWFWCKRVTSIPILDLTTQYSSIREDVETAVLKVLASGRYIKGAIVTQFEQELANYIDVSSCVSCNSGTDALYLALRAMGIGPGDEVITTPFTFIATAEVISALGATPIFVDIDPYTYNLDLTRVEAAISDRTRAIIPVHLFGRPVNMTQLMAIAQAHKLWVIEDCAQAIGAEWQGQKVGSFGHVGCFSFYPTKNLGACGDGGAITTNDEAIAHTMRTLADHGRTHGYYHEAIGVNSRLDAIQAAVLSVKLQYLDQWNTLRTQVANYYNDQLKSCPHLMLPSNTDSETCVWHQYTVQVTANADANAQPTGAETPEGNLRDQVRQALQEQGISTMIYYPLPLHQQPAYISQQDQPVSLPVAEQVSRQVLSLPMFPELTRSQQDTIIHALQQVLMTDHSYCEG